MKSLLTLCPAKSLSPTLCPAKNVRSILGNTRRADISFYSSGKIDITSRIANALGMVDGDVIDIMMWKGEFYLYVSVHASDICGRHEAQCFPSKRGGRHFRTWCRRLCSAIISECGSTVPDALPRKVTSRASLAAGEVVEIHGRKAIAIITRNIIHHD